MGKGQYNLQYIRTTVRVHVRHSTTADVHIFGICKLLEHSHSWSVNVNSSVLEIVDGRMDT